jgi:hypothetical protein
MGVVLCGCGRCVNQWVKPEKHGCENLKCYVRERQGQGNKKAWSQERLVLRQVTVKMRGQDELTEKQTNERSEGNARDENATK